MLGQEVNVFFSKGGAKGDRRGQEMFTAASIFQSDRNGPDTITVISVPQLLHGCPHRADSHDTSYPHFSSTFALYTKPKLTAAGSAPEAGLAHVLVGESPAPRAVQSLQRPAAHMTSSF